MQTLPRKPRATLTLSANTIELRREVERLEFARREAISRRDFNEVDNIDKQLVAVSAKWAASFAADHEERVRKTA